MFATWQAPSRPSGHGLVAAVPHPEQASRVPRRLRSRSGVDVVGLAGRQAAKASPVTSRHVVAYADLTLLGGRHRLRDLTPAKPPRLHPIADRAVCGSIHDGTSGFPAVLRECAGCAKQVWVSTALLELVDAQRLHPVCLGCHLSDRAPMELHPGVMPSLYVVGRSADAQRAVACLNGLEFSS